MKKFWLFAGDQYYPARALGNFRGSFNSLEDLVSEAKILNCDWIKVVEVENNSPVNSYDYNWEND